MALWPGNKVPLLCEESSVNHFAILNLKQTIFSLKNGIMHDGAVPIVLKAPYKRRPWKGTSVISSARTAAMEHAMLAVSRKFLTFYHCSVAGVFEAESSTFLQPDGYKMELVHHASEVHSFILLIVISILSTYRLHRSLDCIPLMANSTAPVCYGQGTDRPPLLFVHGSFHAAWCWQVCSVDKAIITTMTSSLSVDFQRNGQHVKDVQLLSLQEHYQPHFANTGYESYAVSLRGQGKSTRQEGIGACSLAEHVKDLSHIISSLPRPPVLIGHSFGGLVVQR